MISVILNVYKRPYTLEAQIEAIKNQSINIKSEDIHVWYNTPEDNTEQFLPEDENIRTYECNYNTKFFGRFMLPLICKTPYIAMLDDDTIPSKDWLKNCLDSINKCNGILGASGVITNGKTYVPNMKVGWNGLHSDKIEKVDLVGHGWFFKQEWAKFMWMEEPPSWDNGEDMFFSYMAQKNGVDTFVPPHPENNVDLWGNNPKHDHNWGFDKNAHSLSVSNHLTLRNSIVGDLINKGWETIKKTPKTKTFRGHFDMLLDKLKSGEHFGYCRFSDGEFRIMENIELILAADHYKIGDKKLRGTYAAEDHKHFDPSKHNFHHNKLMESYRFKKDNYFVGLSCRCCIGEKDFKRMLEMYEGDTNSDNLTWSNLFLNGNYPAFIKEYLPEFKKKKIVYIVNENAVLSGLPFEVVKDFRVGENCIINNYDMVEEVKNWIDDNNIEDHVFLFSASSLSNFMVHQLFEHNNKNTYIDVGTTLNPYIGMKARRGYHNGNSKICIW